MEFKIKGEESKQTVAFSLAMTEDGDVDIMADDYYIARLDVETGKMFLYCGIDPTSLGLKVDDDGYITVEREDDNG